MRRRPVREIEHHFVDVTPPPSFRWIIGFDDRVPGRAKMLCGVSIWRLIAATDMAAGPADAQMQPGVAQFQAFLTPRSARNDVYRILPCRSSALPFAEARHISWRGAEGA